MSHADTLREALRCGKPSCPCTRGRNVHCASHDDGQPSLTLDERDGQILMHCKTGCTQQQVIEALAGRGLWPVPDKVTPITRAKGEPDHLYRYVTADGELVGEKGRWNGPPKTFRWRKPDEKWGETQIPMDSMPLYNLASVLGNPDKPVWFVEGEKAVEACHLRGLVAVCLPGGASQQRFGNALDVLQGREVILWPDNDDAGEGLMDRLLSLLPNAKLVKPVVPEKGDAHDYFAQGGTVDGLTALMREGKPLVSFPEMGAVRVEIPHPAGAVAFTFSEMAWTTRAIDALMTVDCRVTGIPRISYMTRLNIASASGRDGIRREIENVFGGKKEVEWSRMLAIACTEADRAWKSQDSSIDLFNVKPQPRKWLLTKRVPLNAVSIFFGMGGSTKSLQMLDLVLHGMHDATWLGIPMEPIRGVLVVDYEDQPDEWRIRAESICKANSWEFPEGRFIYLSGDAIPLPEQAQRIKALIKKYAIDVLIIDSASSASGGQLTDTVAVSRTVNFLQSLGITVLLTAHNTKAEDTQYPYGSINWHNLVRATHYVERKQEPGSTTAYVTIWNRKANRGEQRPIGARVEFPEGDEGPTYIERDDQAIDLTASPEVEHRSVTWRIWQWLSRQPEPQPVEAIATALELDVVHVRKELNRQKSKWFTNRGDTKKGLWAALSRRDEAAS